MENKNCNCGETLESIKESDKDKPEESIECGCGCDSESVDEFKESGCCESESIDEPKEEGGCGCGLDKGYPDESIIDNPNS